MFSICMYGLLASLNPNEPTYKLEYSLIGNNPGMGYRPYSDNVDEKGALIWYVASNQTNIKMWTSSLDNFLHGTESSFCVYLIELIFVIFRLYK